MTSVIAVTSRPATSQCSPTLSSITDEKLSEDQLKAAVRKLKDAGADLIKIFASKSIRDGGAQTMSGKRANVVPGVSPKLEKPTLKKWFNTAAFSVPGPYEFGSASRTIPNVHGPGIKNVDASLQKRFVIREPYTVQFRAEAFNIFNRTHFAIPVRILEAPSFGRSVDTYLNPRQIQFALKYVF